MEQPIVNNEIEVLRAIPKHRAIDFDKLPYCDGERENTVLSLIERGFIKKDSYWACWLTMEGKLFLKDYKDGKENK